MKLVLLLLVTSCAATESKSAEALYLGQQLSCVDQSATKVEADACRAKVKAEWAKGNVDGGGE